MEFCASTANLWQIVGWILLIFKIAIPILLIVFGIIDLGKAVIASKDDEIKKSVKSLAMRAAAGIIIFLIPTIIGFIMGFVNDFRDKDSAAYKDFIVCRKCIISPGKCDEADQAWNAAEN